MARINIETSIYRELSFQDLIAKTGDRHKAKGMLLELWDLAQQYWFPERKLIPVEEIKKWGLELCLECGLAELREGGVYSRGSEEAFAWLFQKQEAGIKSGQARKVKFKKVSEEIIEQSTPVEHPLTDDERTRTSLLSSLYSNKEYICQPDAKRIESTSENPPELVAPPEIKNLGAQILFEIWNTNRGTLPKASSLSQKRAKHANARWKEAPDELYWIAVVKQLAASPFCRGDNKTKWKATFDYFIRADTHLKVSEGQWSDPTPKRNYV